MRKICLSDNDFEFFDIEMTPVEFQFFQRHRDAFTCMWKEQGKPFWTKFTITFRSFTVKHGVIKQMACTTPKFEHLLDQAFIFIHENFVDGRESNARHFIEDVAKLAQNHNRFQALDSKSFAKDPFYIRETRELFRRLFGQPDDKASYLKVYILSPIYLRFGGSLCRCIKKWMEAPEIDCNDDSYWTPPSGPPRPGVMDKKNKVIMCKDCLDECCSLFKREKSYGERTGPKFISFWTYGNPRFNDRNNPLYCLNSDRSKDWRDDLTIEDFRDFLDYAKFNYGTESDRCQECQSLMPDKTGHDNYDKECSDKRKKKKTKKKKKKVEDCVTNLVDNVLGSSISKRKEENSDEKKTIDAATNFPSPEKKDQCTNTIREMNCNASSVMKSTEKSTIDNVKRASGKRRKNVFSTRALITESYKYGYMSLQENGVPTNTPVGEYVGFRLTHLEEKGKWELKLVVVSHKNKEEEIVYQKKEEKPTKMMRMPYAEMLYSRVENMPKNLEWWDGDTFCVCALDFENEERAFCNKKNKKQPSKFAIKVSNANDETISGTLFHLLSYIGKRKKRDCVGWCLTDEDIMNCILPHNVENHKGLTITVMRGFSFRNRLTAKEESTLKQRRTAKKVLMSVDTSTVFTLLMMPNGKEILKDIVEDAGKSINDVIAKRRTYREDLDMMTKNLDDFEILTAIEEEQVSYMQSLGLHVVDSDHPELIKHSNDLNKQDHNDVGPELQAKISEFLAEYNEKNSAKKKNHTAKYIEKKDFTTLSNACTTQQKETVIPQDQRVDDNLPSLINQPEQDKEVYIPEKQTNSSSGMEEKVKTITTSEMQEEVTDVITASNEEENVTKSVNMPLIREEDPVEIQMKGDSERNPVEIQVDDKNDTFKVNEDYQNHSADETEQNDSAETDTEEKEEVEKIADIELKNKSVAERGQDLEDVGLEVKLRCCANCKVVEPSLKAYKKCQKCKLEGIQNARYYCGRQCQEEDWKARHKKEHKENLLA